VLGRREREREGGGEGECIGRDGRTGREGGFKARCSGQRGGLTGARVTGPHIGELSVSICLQAEKRGEMQGRQRERDETRRRDRTVKARERESGQRSQGRRGGEG